MATSGQVLPVRVYHTSTRIMLAAPMPGLEPEDIEVRIDRDRVTIHGEQRGRHQHELPLDIAEWSIGPYHREIGLAEPVDGALTNATYGNGVLVLSMPKVSAGHRASLAELRLVTVADGRGERVGHVGRTVVPQTTEAHIADKHAGRAIGRRSAQAGLAYAHVNVWRLALTGGALGATAMSGLTALGRQRDVRVDFESMLGTALGGAPSPGRRRVGFVIQLVNGALLALPYAAILDRLPRAPGWALGAALGLVHAVAAGGLLAAVPAIHPEIPGRLPEPGAFYARQGAAAAALFVAAHVVYGAIVGAVYAAGRRRRR